MVEQITVLTFILSFITGFMHFIAACVASEKGQNGWSAYALVSTGVHILITILFAIILNNI